MIIADSIKNKFDCYIGVYVFMHGIVAYLCGKVFKKPVVQLLPGSDVKYIIKKSKYINVLKKSNVLITRGSITNKELISLGVESDKLIVVPN